MKKYFGLLIVLSFLVFGISKAEATAIVAPAADSVSTTVSIGRTLNVGSSGEDVKVLQNILKQKGYLSASATGYYGSLTKSAVKKYQKDAKLTTVSGLVDADTLAKIQSNIAKSVPPTPIFINDIESLPAASKPFIHIVGSSGGQVSDSSISVKMGSTFTVSGVPQNLHGLSYYFGTGSPTTGYFSRAYFFDQNFGDNNSCGNNEALADNTWVMTCTAKVMGSSEFYIEIYANGQIYKSNTVSVKILPTSAASVTVLSPNGGETFTAGQKILVRWNSNNLPASTPLYILIQHHSPAGGGIDGANYATNLNEGTVLNDGNETVTLPTQYSGRPFGKYFKIAVTTDPRGGAINPIYDTSDNLFAINNVGVINSGDNTQRISYWYGKVNQHIDANGNWLTDPDGVSGADLDKLSYCQKWFPNTTSVADYKFETMTGWRNRGNVDGPFTSTRMSTKCI